MSRPAPQPKPRPAPTKRRRVALIIETSGAPWRGILSGIGRYMREHRPWLIHHHDLRRHTWDWLNNWEGDGIIARFISREHANAVRKRGLPIVDVLGTRPELPLVHIDDGAIGRLAAEHLMDRGFKQFGFVGIKGSNWSQARRDAFVEKVASKGFASKLLELHFDERPWEEEQQEIADFIASLPKPAGVMACHDPCGQRVLEACLRVNVTVPDEIAVIAVDNDEPFCEVSNPPLSSILANHDGVGYQAAALLDRLMDGEATPTGPLLMQPSGIVARMSTDVLAVEDPHVAIAAKFIRDHACDGIGVDDVVDQVPFSHTVLQQRFKQAFGRSVHEEILQTRLKRAKQLLVETNLPMAEIAERVGIENPEYFGVVFKSKTGQTPAKYRQHIRGLSGRRFNP
jgi:LacI family transcriptional regulator